MTDLPDNILRLRDIARNCYLCPRACAVDRLAGRRGICRVGPLAVVTSAGPHFGEESVLVGRGGSGTIFFAGCNLRCIFCQNADISQSPDGKSMSTAELARQMQQLERQGCENINFVSPTQFAHVLAEAIFLARLDGLGVPVVYNSGGYDSVQTLRLLEGLIDIYLPDFKWAQDQNALEYSGVPRYFEHARAAVAEMYRQVGPLRVEDGVARKGLLVRHLVMPGDLARSRAVIDAIAEVAGGCAVNIMGQYYPAYNASQHPELLGRVSGEELEELRQYAASMGLVRVY